MSQDPRKLLTKATDLIERDIAEIEVLSAAGKLPPHSAADLARYIQSLLALAQDADAVDQNQTKKLSELSSEELENLVRSYIATDPQEEPVE